jgi:hypothetical protein
MDVCELDELESAMLEVAAADALELAIAAEPDELCAADEEAAFGAELEDNGSVV